MPDIRHSALSSYNFTTHKYTCIVDKIMLNFVLFQQIKPKSFKYKRLNCLEFQGLLLAAKNPAFILYGDFLKEDSRGLGCFMLEDIPFLSYINIDKKVTK